MQIDNKQRLILEPLLLFLVMFLPGYFGGGSESGASLLLDSGNLIVSLVVAIPQILLLGFLISGDKSQLSEFGIVRLKLRLIPASIAVAVGMLALLVPILIILRGLDLAVNPYLANLDQVQISFRSVSVLVLQSLLVGYREELFFRSYLHGRLLQAGLSQFPAASLSILLFAAGHLYQGVVAFLEVIFLALILTVLFRRFRNIHLIAIGHGLYNVCVVLLLMIGPRSLLSNMGVSIFAV